MERVIKRKLQSFVFLPPLPAPGISVFGSVCCWCCHPSSVLFSSPLPSARSPAAAGRSGPSITAASSSSFVTSSCSYTDTCGCVHACIYLYTYIHVHVYIYIDICTQVCTRVCLYVYIKMSVCIYKSVCMYIYKYIYVTHLYIYRFHFPATRVVPGRFRLKARVPERGVLWVPRAAGWLEARRGWGRGGPTAEASAAPCRSSPRCRGKGTLRAVPAGLRAGGVSSVPRCSLQRQPRISSAAAAPKPLSLLLVSG